MGNCGTGGKDDTVGRATRNKEVQDEIDKLNKQRVYDFMQFFELSN